MFHNLIFPSLSRSALRSSQCNSCNWRIDNSTCLFTAFPVDIQQMSERTSIAPLVRRVSGGNRKRICSALPGHPAEKGRKCEGEKWEKPEATHWFLHSLLAIACCLATPICRLLRKSI